MAKKKEKFQSEIDQPFLHSMEKNRLKSNFLPYRVKKHHSTLEIDTFLSRETHMTLKSPFLISTQSLLYYYEQIQCPICLL